MKVYLYPTPLHYRQIPELIDKRRRDRADRHRHVPRRLRAQRRRLRLPLAALRHRRRRAAEGRDAPRSTWRSSACACSRATASPRPRRCSRSTRRCSTGTERSASSCRSSRRGSSPCPASTRAGGCIVRGPNVMIGYYRADNPGELEPPPGGWHDTGDIVAIDAEGFVAIKGRAKRFAKIAGELVSLGAVEDLVSGLWPDDLVAAVAAPDPKRGERVILATTQAGATRMEVADLDEDQGRLRNHVPRPRSSSSTRSRCSARARPTISRWRGSCGRRAREWGGPAPFPGANRAISKGSGSISGLS